MQNIITYVHGCKSWWWKHPEECRDFVVAHFHGVALVLEENKTLDPVNVALLGAKTKVPDLDGCPYLIEKQRLVPALGPSIANCFCLHSQRGFTIS
ncbi:MAG: hypothetical protein ACREUI_03670, partial [Burkholderiales bacterium]